MLLMLVSQTVSVVIKTRGDEKGEVGLLVLGAVIILAAILVPVQLFSVWRVARVAASVGPNVWVRPCVDADAPRTWRALAMDDRGLSTLDIRGRTVATWDWSTIRDINIASVEVDLRRRTGVAVGLANGDRVEMLMPGRGTLGFPIERCVATASEARRRLLDYRQRTPNEPHG